MDSFLFLSQGPRKILVQYVYFNGDMLFFILGFLQFYRVKSIYIQTFLSVEIKECKGKYRLFKTQLHRMQQNYSPLKNCLIFGSTFSDSMRKLQRSWLDLQREVAYLLSPKVEGCKCRTPFCLSQEFENCRTTIDGDTWL